MRRRPALSSASCTPLMNACDWGRTGMLGVLARQAWPVAAVLQGDVGEGAADIDGDRESGCQARASTYPCGGRPRRRARSRRRLRWLPRRPRLRGSPRRSRARRPRRRRSRPARPAARACGRAVERVAAAAAAAGLDAQHVAACAAGCRPTAGPARARRSRPGLTTARPVPPAMPPAVPQGGFFTLSMRTASTASSARISYSRTMPQPPRYWPAPPLSRMIAVGAQPHRIAEFQELDRVVLLRDEIDGVDAVGVGPRAVADADAVGHQERLAARRSAAQKHDDIGGVRGRGRRAGDVDQPVQRRQHPHHGQAAHAERGREARPQQRALAQPHLVERRGPPALQTCGGSPPRKNRPSAMPGTSRFIRKLTGPGAWSSVSVASKMKRSSVGPARGSARSGCGTGRCRGRRVSIASVKRWVPYGEGLARACARTRRFGAGQQLAQARRPATSAPKRASDLLDAARRRARRWPSARACRRGSGRG